MPQTQGSKEKGAPQNQRQQVQLTLRSRPCSMGDTDSRSRQHLSGCAWRTVRKGSEKAGIKENRRMGSTGLASGGHVPRLSLAS